MPKQGWLGADISSERPTPPVSAHRTRNTVLAILAVITVLLLLSNHFIVVSSDPSFVILKKTSWTFDGCIIGEANWSMFALHHPLLMSRLVLGDGTWVSGTPELASASKPSAPLVNTTHPSNTAHLDNVRLSWLLGRFTVSNDSPEPLNNIRFEVTPGGYALRVKSIGAYSFYDGDALYLVNAAGESFPALSKKGHRFTIRVFSSLWPDQSGAERSASWDL